jgi:hypothetical protein
MFLFRQLGWDRPERHGLWLSRAWRIEWGSERRFRKFISTLNSSPLNPSRSDQPAGDRAFFRWLAILAMTLASCYAIYVHFATPVIPYDDAYITYRHSENFAQNKGLVYNPGQKVFGVSTPLYSIWLTGLRLVFSSTDLPTSAVRANALFFVAAGWGIFFLLRRYALNRWIAAAVAGSFLISRYFLVISVGGMESFLFVALACFALLAASGRRPAAFGFLASLAMLARPEGLVLLPVGLLAFVVPPRSVAWRKIAGACIFWSIPLAIWVVASTIYWGSPIPQSILAKSRPVYPLPAGHAARMIVGTVGGHLTLYSDVLFGVAKSLSWRGLCLFLPVMAGLGLALAFPGLRRRHAYAPALIFLGIFFEYAIGNPLVCPWYIPILLVSATLAIAIGVDAICTAIGRRTELPAKMLAIAGTGLLSLWLVAMSLAYPTFRTPNLQAPATDIAADPGRMRIFGYIDAARWINQRATEKTSIAASEMGALGFYFKGRIFDANGLVSPEAMPFLPVPSAQRLSPEVGAISVDFVKATDPDWVVTMHVFACKSLETSDWFKHRYDLVRSFPLRLETFGDRDIQVYRRKSGAG